MNHGARDQDPPPAPSEAWIEAYEAQATDELFEKATRFAASRAIGVAKAGGHADDLYVLALVQDAFADTFVGILSWDPERASLEQQVISAIRSRSRHDREQAMRFRRVPFDLHDRRSGTADTRAEVEASLAADRAQASDAAVEQAEQALAALRSLAHDDADVQVLLQAFADGACAKHEVLATTRLSAKRYRNARLRLARFVKQLPPEIHHPSRIRA